MKTTYTIPYSYVRVIFTFLLIFCCIAGAMAQNGQGTIKQKKKAKLPPEDLSGVMLANTQYNFYPSELKGVTLQNPTSLQFGPDDRLYVSQQDGIIKAFTISRTSANNYSVTKTEIISLINQIPNHNDNGTLASGVTTRQVTGILVKGTRANPILYVTSSDSRIGGPDGDMNLDTNSGIISRLTWTGSAWSKLDLVRGLPRSEENHSLNGLQLDEQRNMLYVTVGGLTNAGSPSTNFAYLCEFALSAAILSVDLAMLNSMPVKGSGNTAYMYDLPTVDDPTRTNNADGSDQYDPFGGNDGLNQAKIVTGGPVKVYAAGFRNPYDLVITEARRMYSIDNGANQGWGGYPDKEGSNGTVTNNYVAGEPGSTGPGVNDPQVNNLDNLHHIGHVDSYNSGSFYGGHPNPIRANPAGAGLYTYGSSGVWRISKTSSNPLPADWPPLPLTMARPIEGDYQNPGETDNALLTFSQSTNGITEYTASNFSSVLKGSLLAASFDGTIYNINLTTDGTDVTNPRSSENKLNQDLPFASGFGSQPLDVTAQGDNAIFPGTVWAATYGAHAITVFEPQDFLVCSGAYNTNDDDKDGYTNVDEIDNATNPCSAASKPQDYDADFISDLNDTDDDNDKLGDNIDYFAVDAQNGKTTNLPVRYELFNNSPGTGLFGVGFTGLMTNKQPDNDYNNLFDESNLIAGGAVGALTVVNVSAGDAFSTKNNQENGFQFGVNVSSATGPFTVQARMLGAFFNNKVPQNYQSQGIFIGTGDQDNYLKIVLNANNGQGGIEVLYENGGQTTGYQYNFATGIPANTLDLYLSVDPGKGLVQAKYAADGGQVISVGAPIQLSGALLTTLQGSDALALGILSTTGGAAAFTATWDFINVTADGTTQPPAQTTTLRLNSGGGQVTNSIGAFSADNYFSPSPGFTYSNAVAIAGTLDDAMYQTERSSTTDNGSFSYAIPVVNGQYTLKLHFAEIYWTAQGQRVFDVTAESIKVLDNYDIVKKTGAGGVAVVETFTVNVADGTLNLLFNAAAAEGGINRPKVSAIEVIGSSTTNQPPVVNAGADKTITLPTSSTTFTATASDPDGTITSYLWEKVSGPAVTMTNQTTATVSLSGLVQGAYTFKITVTDDKSATASDQVNLTVNAATSTNQTPIANAGPDKTITLPTSSVQLNGSGSDTDGTITAYSWTQSSGPNTATFSSKTVAQPTVSNLVAGSYTFSLTVTDDKGAVSNPDLVVVTVNAQPTQTATIRLNSGGGQLATSMGTFSADNYYSPSPGFTYSNVVAIAGTSDDALYQTERSSTTDNGTFSYVIPVANGNYTLVLHFAEIFFSGKNKRVFDVSAEGIKVLDNYDIVNKVGSARKAIKETIAVTVTDGTLNLLFSAAIADGGINRPKISAIEVIGATSTINQLPVANAGPDQAVTAASSGFASVQLNGSNSSDPDGQIVSYTWSEGSTQLATGATPSISLAVGTHTITLVVTDDKGATASDQVIVSVNAASSTNQTPIANAGPDKTITLPTSSVQLNGSGSDTDGTITAYSWGQSNGPNTAIFSSKTVAQPTVSNLVAGSYTFSLTVTDDKGATSNPDQVVVTVNAQPTQTTTIRLNSGGGQLSTSLGTFSADNYYSPSPGFTFTNNVSISGTSDDVLYQTERSSSTDNGAFSYAIPLPNGQYTLKLHFAELYWWTQGQRVFDVSAESIKVLDNYDIVKKAGAGGVAVVETFTVNVADGTLNLLFNAAAAEGGINRPKVSAIEVLSSSSASFAILQDPGILYGASIIAFPNPNQGDKVNISIKGFNAYEVVELILYDTNGRALQNQTITTDDSGNAQAILSYTKHLNSGIYLVRAQTTSKKVTTRLAII